MEAPTLDGYMAHIQLMSVEALVRNPNNPRVIKDEAFALLCDNIRRFPRMLSIRPVVFKLNKKRQREIIGGDKRYAAAVEVGMLMIPVIDASLLSEEERRMFIAMDNAHSGEWDFEKLLTQYSIDELSSMSISFPSISTEDDEQQNAEPKSISVVIQVKDMTTAEEIVMEMAMRGLEAKIKKK